MWISRFKVFDKDNVLSKILRKNKVRVDYYPVNNYVKNGRHFFIGIGIIQGSNSNIDNYFSDLDRLRHAKKGRRLDFLERSGNFFTFITSHDASLEKKLFVRMAYDPEIIHYRPVIWHADGWEEAHVCAPSRDALQNMIKIGRKLYGLKLLELTERKLSNFGFLTVLPDVTEKQRHAINLAIENGYYEYPRKIELIKLAKIMKISLSTYQAHLRKAEKKLLPYIASQY